MINHTFSLPFITQLLFIQAFSLPSHTFSLLCFNSTAYSGSRHQFYQSTPNQNTERQPPPPNSWKN